ncbi:MAG: hypothetical protein JWM58_1029, partial [Rhizobium sp.]|nr:hypothetical protein [Rhizobium sp.]
ETEARSEDSGQQSEDDDAEEFHEQQAEVFALPAPEGVS